MHKKSGLFGSQTVAHVCFYARVMEHGVQASFESLVFLQDLHEELGTSRTRAWRKQIPRRWMPI